MAVVFFCPLHSPGWWRPKFLPDRCMDFELNNRYFRLRVRLSTVVVVVILLWAAVETYKQQSVNGSYELCPRLCPHVVGDLPRCRGPWTPWWWPL